MCVVGGFASGVWDNLYDEQLVDILREERDVTVSHAVSSACVSGVRQGISC